MSIGPQNLVNNKNIPNNLIFQRVNISEIKSDNNKKNLKHWRFNRNTIPFCNEDTAIEMCLIYHRVPKLRHVPKRISITCSLLVE